MWWRLSRSCNTNQWVFSPQVPLSIKLINFKKKYSSSEANSIANITISAVIKNSIQSHKIKIIDFKLTLAHVAAIVFVCFISLISLLLGKGTLYLIAFWTKPLNLIVFPKGIQYIFRYHKYEKTSREPDSPAHTPTTSHPASRAMSTTTLLSEVISMVKLRPKPSVRHARLRESVDVDTLENQDEQEMEVLKSPR